MNHVKELRKYATCSGLNPSRQRQVTPEWGSQLASKDLGKLWNSAYGSLIHFCVNEKHVLNLSVEIRWISLLLSFCQCRFTESRGITVEPIPTCITFLRQGNLHKFWLIQAPISCLILASLNKYHEHQIEGRTPWQWCLYSI